MDPMTLALAKRSFEKFIVGSMAKHTTAISAAIKNNPEDARDSIESLKRFVALYEKNPEKLYGEFFDEETKKSFAEAGLYDDANKPWMKSVLEGTAIDAKSLIGGFERVSHAKKPVAGPLPVDAGSAGASPFNALSNDKMSGKIAEVMESFDLQKKGAIKEGMKNVLKADVFRHATVGVNDIQQIGQGDIMHLGKKMFALCGAAAKVLKGASNAVEMLKNQKVDEIAKMVKTEKDSAEQGHDAVNTNRPYNSPRIG